MFSQDTFIFLEALAANNSREWFEANRSRYEAAVLDPALDFIEAMAPLLKTFAPRFEAIPRKTGGSLMRIYRDTRFSRDKSPYKTNIGIQFRHALGKDIHAPGFYVHIAADECFIGAGCWHPEPDALAAIRDHVAGHTEQWVGTMQTLPGTDWQIWGEKTIRPPRGYDPQHPLIEELKRKDFILLAMLDRKQVCSPDFHQHVATQFACTESFMRMLCTALNVQY